MPNRLKGIIVSPKFGRPYLSATQMLDLRPSHRKFISLKAGGFEELSAVGGTILVTRSGSVGRSTIAHRLHEGAALSDDLIRVVPHDPAAHGWIYAYLRTPSARQMMTSVHYGHMIKHLEPAHLSALPIPIVDAETLVRFNSKVQTMLEMRNRSYERLLQAESLFEEATGGRITSYQGRGTPGFQVRSSDLFKGRRRFEANFHNPGIRSILNRFQKVGLHVDPLSRLAERVWWGARFRRVFGDGGLPYYSADALWTLNPPPEKHILVDHEEAADAARYMVKPGWLIMACSGQVYGLNGSVDLVTDKLARSFLSHDIIRISPVKDVRPGYLLVALGHPQLGRPLVIRNAYGSSIPHLDPDDVAATPVVRIKPSLEGEIADAGEESVWLRQSADALENSFTSEAESLTERFLARMAG
jgi:hypothetical protein